MSKAPLHIIGYSGHAYVCLDAASSQGYPLGGYFEEEEKVLNPQKLQYLGTEKSAEAHERLRSQPFFIGIGAGKIRQNIQANILQTIGATPENLLHKHAWVSPSARLLGRGVLVAAGAVVNALAMLHDGVIVNSNATVEHECVLGEYAHIAPGATLCGNVSIGSFTHVGANAVIRENIKVADHVIIGAGAVVINDITESGTYVGIPARMRQYPTT